MHVGCLPGVHFSDHSLYYRLTSTLKDVRSAAEQLLKSGPGTVFVKHLGVLGLDGGQSFEMLLCTQEATYHIAAPWIPFDRPPVGVGDLTSGTLLAKHLLTGVSAAGGAGNVVGVPAFEHTTAVYNAVMVATAGLDEYELQTVAAQDEIAFPSTRFVATKL
jgi:pyridoxine kinase